MWFMLSQHLSAWQCVVFRIRAWDNLLMSVVNVNRLGFWGSPSPSFREA